MAGVGHANNRNPEREEERSSRSGKLRPTTCELWLLPQLAAIGGSVTMKREGAMISVISVTIKREAAVSRLRFSGKLYIEADMAR